MSRLFVTSREIQFINDLTKEVIKDVIGQQIIYYPISTMKTQIHPIYEEAVEKIFENPIRLDVLAGQPNWETKWNQFGNEQVNKFELFVQARDLLDKGYKLSEGDFFLYGDQLYELVTFIPINNIYGQVEYTTGYKLEGKVARKGQFDVNIFKQMLKDQGVKYVDNSVTKIWQQQRGLTENIEGETLDRRQMRDRLAEDMAPIALEEGARIVNVDADPDPTHKPEEASSFDNNSPTYVEPVDIYNED